MIARTNVAAQPKPAEPVLVLQRVFDAPRGRVFTAWTDTKHLVQWSCPRDFTITHCQGDPRPAGVWRCCMRAANGTELWLGGVYREIVAPERLVFTHAWDDRTGKPGHETLVTVTFTERQGKTEMNFQQTEFTSVESRDGHREGWSESFDKLAEYLRLTE